MNTPSWTKALDQLVRHPSLTPAQVRHLLGKMPAPRADVVQHLVNMLASTKPGQDTDAQDAAYILDVGLDAQDRDWVLAFVGGTQPVALRAWVRALFQNGLLQGRLTEAQADVPVPNQHQVDFWVEDVARELGDVPQTLERVRVAAEALVGDSPVAAEQSAQAVAALAARLVVPASAIWAELLIHPLTHSALREQATAALAQPHGPAAPVLAAAEPVLLPGSLHDAAVSAHQHHRAAPDQVLCAWMSGSNTAGIFAALFTQHGSQLKVLGGVFSHEPGQTQIQMAEDAQAAEAEMLVWTMGQELRGWGPVPAGVAAALVLESLSAGAPSAQAAGTLKAWCQAAAVPLVVPVLPAAATLDTDALMHPLARSVRLGATDIPEKWKRELSKEMRARGRPREETLRDTCADLGRRPALMARLARAAEHGAKVAQARGDAAAGALVGLAQALTRGADADGQLVSRTLVMRAVGASTQEPGPVASHRDDVRDLVLPGNKPVLGVHVLQMDLSASAWEAALTIPGGLAGLDEDAALELCTHAGGLAAMALVQPGADTEETRLQDAAKKAILERAEKLPSRQRRELVDLWTRAWLELLNRACRGTCSQRCLQNLKEPRPDAAFMLEHPRHNLPWPA